MKKILLISVLMPLLMQAQLVNQGFEQWETPEGAIQAHPSGWPLLAGEYLYQQTDSYEGEYALTISAWYAYLKTVAVQENAIDSRPVSFNGYYKYTDNQVRYYDTDNILQLAPDTAIVSVYLTKWDPIVMHSDTIASGTIELSGSENYSQFTCPLHYTSEEIPDSFKVILDPSKVRRFSPDIYRAYNAAECSFFTVDNLFFNDESLGLPNAAQSGNTMIYPNPATDRITIQTSQNKPLKLILYDNGGKMVFEKATSDGDREVLLEGLSCGIYHVMIYDSYGTLMETEKLVLK